MNERWRPDSEQDVFADLPKDSINPKSLTSSQPEEGYTNIPKTAYAIYAAVPDWVATATQLTNDRIKEHGFYIDTYGNVIGIIDGERNKMKFPKDYLHNIGASSCHTHPFKDSYPPEAMMISNRDVEPLLARVNDKNVTTNCTVIFPIGNVVSIISVIVRNNSAPKPSIDNRKTEIFDKLEDHLLSLYNEVDKKQSQGTLYDGLFFYKGKEVDIIRQPDPRYLSTFSDHMTKLQEIESKSGAFVDITTKVAYVGDEYE